MAWRWFAFACVLVLGADPAAAAPCTSSWDCLDANAPLCASQVCSPGPMCTADDPADQGAGDDGPAAATVLALPARLTRAACRISGETDFFVFDLATPRDIAIYLAWSDSAGGFHANLYDAQGALLTLHMVEPRNFPYDPYRTFRAALMPGRYYVVVHALGELTPNAFAYELAVHEIECRSAFDCTDPARPACSTALECAAGPAECTGDDPRDAGAGDDGPAAAKLLADGEVATGAVCSKPGEFSHRDTVAQIGHYTFTHWDRDEADWYAIDVAAGEGLIVRLAFAAGAELDLVMFDARGEFIGRSRNLNPERVTLTYLPAGRYYARVTRPVLLDERPEVLPYSISFERTPAQSCASAADCAAEHETQYFRGACNTGVCEFLGPATVGKPCDFSSRAFSGCGYRLFQANAHKHRIGVGCRPETCAPDEHCAGYTPPGLPGCGPQGCPERLGSCTLKCTCDAECGIIPTFTPTDGSPWVYASCRSDGVCLPDTPGDPATCADDPEPAPPTSGCGCRSGAGGAAASAPLLLALLALRRRRRLPLRAAPSCSSRKLEREPSRA